MSEKSTTSGQHGALVQVLHFVALMKLCSIPCNLLITSIFFALFLRAANIPADPANPVVYLTHGEYQKAADLCSRLIAEREQPGHLDQGIAVLYMDLGLAYRKLGRDLDAEHALLKCLTMWKALGGIGSGRALGIVGSFYVEQQQYEKAEPLLRASLRTLNEMPEAVGSDFGLVYDCLGTVLLNAHKEAEAEDSYRKALQSELKVRPYSIQTAATYNNLAYVFAMTGRDSEAETYYTNAIKTWEASAGPNFPDVATGLHNLAMVQKRLERSKDAEANFKRALGIVQSTLPPDHPLRAVILADYASLLRETGRKHEAKKMETLARELRARHDHENFRDVTVDVHSLLAAER